MAACHRGPLVGEAGGGDDPELRGSVFWWNFLHRTMESREKAGLAVGGGWRAEQCGGESAAGCSGIVLGWGDSPERLVAAGNARVPLATEGGGEQGRGRGEGGDGTGRGTGVVGEDRRGRGGGGEEKDDGGGAGLMNVDWPLVSSSWRPVVG